jgi:hypothetical protein
MGKLMAGARVGHGGLLNDFIGLFIHHKAVVRVDTLDVVLSLLSSNDEYFVLGLDRRKLSWQLVSITYLDALGGLT